MYFKGMPDAYNVKVNILQQINWSESYAEDVFNNAKDRELIIVVAAW